MIERMPLKWMITEGQNTDIGISKRGGATVSSIDIPFFEIS
jgi:hypothetical protein